MPRFQFRLEKVLQLKQRQEDQAKEKVAALKRLYVEEEFCLASLQAQLGKQHAQFAAACSDRLNGNQVQQSLAFLSYLQEEILQQQKRLQELVAALEGARAELTKASRKKQVLEEIRGRAYREYLRDLLSAEQRSLDELAGIGFLHKGVSPA